MRPGMPLGRKHFRRSRDAPIFAHSRQNHANGNYVLRKGLWPVLLSKIIGPKALPSTIYLSRWRKSVKTLDERESQGDSERVVDDRNGRHRKGCEGRKGIVSHSARLTANVPCSQPD